MKITIDIPEKYITILREANDPEREVWNDNGDVTENDLAGFIYDYLSCLEV